MKHLIKIVYLLIILTSVFQNGFSQNENLKIEHISLEQGVSNNLIFSIYQDSKGFIWYGTMFGLVKYDGVSYKTYRNDPLDSNSLSNDDIISILEDKDGNLWFGTFNGGLNKYERSINKFTRYLNDPENENSISNNTVWVIRQDKNGVMWFATEGGGLNKFEDGKFTAYKKDTANTTSISGNFIRSLETDSKGNVWAGTIGSGLNMYDKEKKAFTIFRNDSNNVNSLSANFVSSIFEDSKGTIWVGTTGGGLNKFDPETRTFKRYKNDSNNINSISGNAVFTITEDSPGVLLLGTNNGLNKFFEAQDKFEKIGVYPNDNTKKEIVLAFIKDRSGVLWLSSYNDGLYKVQFTLDKFKSLCSGNNVTCIFEDNPGRLWIGTDLKGLQMSEDGGKSFTSLVYDEKNKPGSINSNKVSSVAEDSEGNIWIGTDRGLNKYISKENTFIKYTNDPKVNTSLISDNILKVFFDRSGTLWVGTDKGLNKFDEASNSFTNYQNIRGDSKSLSENTILSIYEDKYNEIWIGTYYGLNKLDRQTGEFKHYKKDPSDPKTISNNYVFSFNEDEANNFWIGTGGGLNVFDRKTETFHNFTERDGLPNGVIAGIESGRDGYLWISTFKGLSRFSVKEKQFKNFDTEDGLLSNMFNTGSYFKTGKGEILFGSLNGVNYFTPGEVIQSEYIAPVILTSLTKYDDKEKTELDISDLKEIELSYKDNIINIAFASMDFTNPVKNKFVYKLEGFEDEWINSGDRNEAVYTNLDPGEYVFKVKGTNSDGVWNENAAEITITVTPPFWKTWWFYGILICALTGGVLFVQNYRVRQKVKYLVDMEKIKERERELMREQASRDYHDELGHKLTRISLYSRRINKKLRPTANGLTEDLNSIVETSNSLQSGAKDLIWAMNPKEDTMYDFTVRLRDFGNELFENTGINFHADASAEEFKNIYLSMNCKRHMIYIFKEGMNNILKYSRCENVTLLFRLDGDAVEIILRDDGKGFDPHNCAKGYGLKNIYSRAKQINIQIEISSEKDKGTEIKLRAGIPNLISI